MLPGCPLTPCTLPTLPPWSHLLIDVAHPLPCIASTTIMLQSSQLARQKPRCHWERTGAHQVASACVGWAAPHCMVAPHMMGTPPHTHTPTHSHTHTPTHSATLALLNFPSSLVTLLLLLPPGPPASGLRPGSCQCSPEAAAGSGHRPPGGSCWCPESAGAGAESAAASDASPGPAAGAIPAADGRPLPWCHSSDWRHSGGVSAHHHRRCLHHHHHYLQQQQQQQRWGPWVRQQWVAGLLARPCTQPAAWGGGRPWGGHAAAGGGSGALHWAVAAAMA